MTHPSPEAVAKAMALAAKLAQLEKANNFERFFEAWPYDFTTLAAHVTALTTQLEAERARSSQPIKMILFCPACGEQHVDELDERTPGWENPPHRSHLCHACGHIWRPADVATEGVRAIETVGKADKPLATSLTTRLSAETARADKAEAEAKALREALEKIAFGPIVACPFDSEKCTVKPDEPCPVCGDVNDFDAPTNCGTGNARSIARATLAQSRSDSECDLPAADGGGFKPSAECIAEIEQIHRGQAEAAKAYLANPGAYLVGKDGGLP